MSNHVSGFAVHAAVKRFSVRLGPIEFHIERAEKSASLRSVEPMGRIAADMRPRRSVVGLTAIGTAGLALASAATLGLGLLGTGAKAGAGAYVVRVPVPERVKPPAPRHATTPEPARAVEQAVADVPSTPIAPAAVPAEPHADAADATHAGEEPLVEASDAQFGSREAAVAAAVGTGRLQQWSDPAGAERGFVVVGRPDDGPGGCRDLSVLTRRDGEDKVSRTKWCRSGEEPGAVAAAPAAG